MTEKRNTGRFVLVALVLLAAMAGLGFRLVCLHLIQTDTARDRVRNLRHLEKTRVVGRGMIFDRRGAANVLALDLPAKDVISDPKVVAENADIEMLTSQLATVLEMEPADVMVRLDQPGRRFERIRRAVPDGKIEELREMHLPGVFFKDTTTRHYPQKTFMCHVLGFANHQGVGSAGVEQEMNRFLRGCPGLLESEVDGRRREIYVRRSQDIPPREGADLHLTLDQHIQYAVETALDKTMEKSNARAAWAIVQHIGTGKILAMASRPGYDPNRFNEMPKGHMLNRAIGVVYEPGSTMKAVTIAAAIDQGLVTPETMIDCERGSWLHCGRVLRDHHPYGMLSVADVLKKSSNIGSAKIALMLGDQRLAKYMRAFGLGKKLGVDLPGEEQGILHPVERWTSISSSRLAIGQGVAVTSLQMLSVMCTIANDGRLMKPSVVSRVVAKDGSVLYG
jgi:cell division protein FtsI (penicillin-binding protein 3)